MALSRAFLALSLLLALLSPSSAQPSAAVLCPHDAPGSLCTIFNQTISFSQGYSLAFKGSVVFANSSISSGPCDSVLCPNHAFGMTVGGNLSLVSTVFALPSVQIIATGPIAIDAASLVNATGMGPLSLSAEGGQGAGGGHGGAGADSPQSSGTGIPGQAFLGNLTSPFDFGGAASFLSFSGLLFSRGGGRIWLASSQGAITISGQLLANGAPSLAPLPPNDERENGLGLSDASTLPGAGAGGSITVIAAGALTLGPLAYVSTTGGSASFTGAGAGGIIAFQSASLSGASAANVNVTGGETLSVDQAAIAGAGLFFHATIASSNASLAAVRRPTMSEVDTAGIAQLLMLKERPSTQDLLPFIGSEEENNRHDDSAHVLARCLSHEALGQRRLQRAKQMFAMVSAPPLRRKDWEDWQQLAASAQVHRDRAAKHLALSASGEVVQTEQAEGEDHDVHPSFASLIEKGAVQWCLQLHPHAFLDALPSAGELPALRQTQLAAAIAAGPEGSALAPPLSSFFLESFISCASLSSHTQTNPLTPSLIQQAFPPVLASVSMTDCSWILELPPSNSLSSTSPSSSSSSLPSLSSGNGEMSRDLVPTFSAVSLRMSTSSIQSGTSQMLVNVTGNLLMTSFSRMTSSSGGFAISVNGNVSISTSLVSSSNLVITTAQRLTVSQQSYVRFGIDALITARQQADLLGTVSQGDLPPVKTTIIVRANTAIVGPDAVIAANTVLMEVPSSIQVQGGSIQAAPSQFGQAGTVCPAPGVQASAAVDTTTQCSTNDPLSSSFSLWLATENLQLTTGGSVLGSTIRVCSRNVVVGGTASISSVGLGCASGTGTGAGTSVVNAASSGAGHGGTGGAGEAAGNLGPVVVSGGIAYDNSSLPAMLGSGGGDVNLGGTGGGLIWLETFSLILDGAISGAGGVGVGSSSSGGSGGGGGSGGSFLLIAANLSGVGMLDFGGGAAGPSSGAGGAGGGGGGVLRVMWLDFDSAQQEDEDEEESGQSEGGYFGCVKQTWSSSSFLSSSSSSPWSACASRLQAERRPLVDASKAIVGVAGNSFMGVLRNAGGLGSSPGLAGNRGVSASTPACPEGAGGALCLLCAPGYYKSTAGNDGPCMPCPKGQFANVSGSTSCSVCPGASIAPSTGTPECQACPPAFLPNVNKTSCDICALGRGGPRCNKCAAGFFSNTTTTDPCQPCSAGSAQPLEGQVACNPCTPMTFSPVIGQKTCESCPLGSFSTTGASQCSLCPPKPLHSTWTYSSSADVVDPDADLCSFICEPGYAGQSCMSIYGTLGHGYGVGGIALGLVSLTLFAQCCWLSFCKPKRKMSGFAYSWLPGTSALSAVPFAAMDDEDDDQDAAAGGAKGREDAPYVPSSCFGCLTGDFGTRGKVDPLLFSDGDYRSGGAPSPNPSPATEVGMQDCYLGLQKYSSVLEPQDADRPVSQCLFVCSWWLRCQPCCSVCRICGQSCCSRRRRAQGAGTAGKQFPGRAAVKSNGSSSAAAGLGTTSLLGHGEGDEEEEESNDGNADRRYHAPNPTSSPSRTAAISISRAAITGAVGGGGGGVDDRDGASSLSSSLAAEAMPMGGLHMRTISKSRIPVASFNANADPSAAAVTVNAAPAQAMAQAPAASSAMHSPGASLVPPAPSSAAASTASRGTGTVLFEEHLLGQSSSSAASSSASSDSNPAIAALASRHLIYRVFFDGVNTPFRPLRLEPPPASSSLPLLQYGLIYEPEFKQHCAEVNDLALWSTWEVRLCNLVRGLCLLPLAVLLEAHFKAKHVRRLQSYYLSVRGDFSFLRNTRARALGNCVLFGHSSDNTCAWVDFFASDSSEAFTLASASSAALQDYQRTAMNAVKQGIPSIFIPPPVFLRPISPFALPAVLPCSGDGSFLSPFRLDLTEPLTVLLLSAFLGPDFCGIATGINNQLRALRGPTLGLFLSLPGHEGEGSRKTGRGRAKSSSASSGSGYRHHHHRHTDAAAPVASVSGGSPANRRAGGASKTNPQAALALLREDSRFDPTALSATAVAASINGAGSSGGVGGEVVMNAGGAGGRMVSLPTSTVTSSLRAGGPTGNAQHQHHPRPLSRRLRRGGGRRTAASTSGAAKEDLVNAGPDLLSQRSALRDLCDFAELVSGTVAARCAIARRAIQDLEALKATVDAVRRDRAVAAASAAAFAQSAASSSPSNHNHHHRAAVSSAPLAGIFSAREREQEERRLFEEEEQQILLAEKAMLSALRWVPFSFFVGTSAAQEASLYFGFIPSPRRLYGHQHGPALPPRPCIILVPRSAPPPDESGTFFPLVLPFGAVAMTSSSAFLGGSSSSGGRLSPRDAGAAGGYSAALDDAERSASFSAVPPPPPLDSFMSQGPFTDPLAAHRAAQHQHRHPYQSQGLAGGMMTTMMMPSDESTLGLALRFQLSGGASSSHLGGGAAGGGGDDAGPPSGSAPGSLVAGSDGGGGLAQPNAFSLWHSRQGGVGGGGHPFGSADEEDEDGGAFYYGSSSDDGLGLCSWLYRGVFCCFCNMLGCPGAADAVPSCLGKTFGKLIPSLRNSTVRGSPTFHALLLLLLLTIDALLTALVVISYLSLVFPHYPFPAVIIVAAFPPFALALAPLVGVVAFASAKPSLHRSHLALEVLSLASALVCLAAGSIFAATQTNVLPESSSSSSSSSSASPAATNLPGSSSSLFDWPTALGLPAGLLLCKLMILPVASLRIAILDLQNDFNAHDPAAVAIAREKLLFPLLTTPSNSASKEGPSSVNPVIQRAVISSLLVAAVRKSRRQQGEEAAATTARRYQPQRHCYAAEDTAGPVLAAALSAAARIASGDSAAAAANGMGVTTKNDGNDGISGGSSGTSASKRPSVIPGTMPMATLQPPAALLPAHHQSSPHAIPISPGNQQALLAAAASESASRAAAMGVSSSPAASRFYLPPAAVGASSAAAAAFASTDSPRFGSLPTSSSLPSAAVDSRLDSRLQGLLGLGGRGGGANGGTDDDTLW